MEYERLGERMEKQPVNTLDELADAAAARFTVGFARHPPIRTGSNCFGSGILVRYGNIAGILTCAHVVAAVVAQEAIGIVANGARDGQKQRNVVDPRRLRRLCEKGNGPEDEGPDLGFIELPAVTMSALEALGSTLSLDRQEERYRQPLQSRHFMEAFSGIPDEWMGQPEDKETHTELELNTMLIGGQISALKSSSDFDRLLFTPGPIPKPLKSYEGMSGGGIWYLGLRGDEATGFSIEDSAW